MPSRPFTAQEKLECAEREVKLRRRVYPQRVLNGRMTQALANEQIALMEAIVEDYRPLVARERLI
jgi:hypothetical protein